MRAERRPVDASARLSITVGALGVVFGDIGTSPLYTVQTVFNPTDPHPVSVTPDHVFGIASLIFWAVTLIVTVKYVAFVLRADNDGEGGILALVTLVLRGGRTRWSAALVGLGILGASLFLGDSVITPAISVLSAVEGLKVVEPALEVLVVPLTVVIVAVLFAGQRLGTARVGRVFGPVMIVYFVVIGVLGAVGVVRHPSVLAALSPTYAIGFLVHDFGTAFFSLAAVVLAVTGAEALYADLGHFGRRPITRAWLVLVFPACVLSYLGQGALLLNDPSAASSPFFLLAPGWARLPLVVLATAATVIASQAVITGAFSITYQAVQLGYLPRLRTVHTSTQAFGQIYVPFVNWALMIGVLALVLAFQSSAALAYAFGMAVTGTFIITTLLYVYVERRAGTPLPRLVVLATVLLAAELLVFAANLTKLLSGAWLPLLIALVLFTVMTTWYRGRALVTRNRERQEGSLTSFVKDLHTRRPPLARVEGTAVFLNRGKETTPLAMRANVERNHVLHSHVVIMSVDTAPVPYVERAERIKVDSLGPTDDGISHVQATVGYLDQTDVPDLLRLAGEVGLEAPLKEVDATYFLSTIELTAGTDDGLAPWRKRLFMATSHITSDAAESFGLPRDRSIVMGSRIEI